MILIDGVPYHVKDLSLLWYFIESIDDKRTVRPSSEEKICLLLANDFDNDNSGDIDYNLLKAHWEEVTS